MYYIYALVSTKHSNRIYVGITNNLKRRLFEHNIGKMKSTKAFTPWELFYCEKVESRIIAREREKKLKSGYGKEYLKAKFSHCPCSSAG